jgi:hypothetical protein
MTETLVGESPPKEGSRRPSRSWPPPGWSRAAQARGVALTGPDGLLKAITKTVLESALEWGSPRLRGKR